MGPDMFAVAGAREFDGHERMKYNAPNATLDVKCWNDAGFCGEADKEDIV